MSVYQFARRQIMAEIDRVVAEAVEDSRIVVTDVAAARIARQFPGADLSLAEIAGEITRKGIARGAALEIRALA